MAMSDPEPRARTCGRTARVTRKTPVRLTRRHSSQRASGVSWVGASHMTPALATSTSMPPSWSTAVATAVSTDASLVTSHVTGTATPPSDVMASATEWMVPGNFPSVTDRAATATDAPARARATAMARPMPRLAPATKATLPSSVGASVSGPLRLRARLPGGPRAPMRPRRDHWARLPGGLSARPSCAPARACRPCSPAPPPSGRTNRSGTW